MGHADASIVLLTADTRDRADLGGKGRSLARLVARGAPVPATAILSTSAYEEFVRRGQLAPFLERLSHEREPPDAREVDARFLAAPISTNLGDQLAAAARTLGSAVAVRSSATVEDGERQSFAGQYRSFLDVETAPAPLLRAVRLVWASLWHPAPWTYRRVWGIGDVDAAMAVVLMRMVPAVEAGVAFTVDPGGDTDRIRVESVAGLGESLVSGARTPAVWLLPREPSRPLPPEVPAHLGTVRRLALGIAADEGQPVDIEWAFDGATTWIVQSRPITVGGHGDGFDTAMNDHELTTAGLEEMLPGVLPPLRWEVNALLVEEALRGTLQELGALVDPVVHSAPFLHRRRGRAALDLDLLKQAAASIPGGTAAEIERGYFGLVDADEPAPRIGFFRMVARDARAARARRLALSDAAIVTEATRMLLEAIPALAPMSDRALLSYRLRVLDLAIRTMTAELAVAALAGGAYTRLERMLARSAGQDAATLALELTRGAGLPEAPIGSASRSVFAGPTWDEDGGAPGTGHPGDRDANGRRATRRAVSAALDRDDGRRRRRRVLTGQVVDVRVELLTRLALDVIDDLRIREGAKSSVLGLGGQVRLVHLELGRRLVERGHLSVATDVELLSSREVVAALQGRSVAPAMVDRRRRVLDQWANAGPLPERFVGVPIDRTPMPTGTRLTGRAASPGRVTARARVVRAPTDRFEEGSVLVASSTDAGWTPLFVRAAGVVVERGGPLSHAAIVARELGVPAVVDVHGATKRLDDIVVTVDGWDGVVVIHEAAGP